MFQSLAAPERLEASESLAELHQMFWSLLRVLPRAQKAPPHDTVSPNLQDR